jgi:hypothetical protein
MKTGGHPNEVAQTASSSRGPTLLPRRVKTQHSRSAVERAKKTNNKRNPQTPALRLQALRPGHRYRGQAGGEAQKRGREGRRGEEKTEEKTESGERGGEKIIKKRKER